MRKARAFDKNGVKIEDSQFEIPSWIPDGAYPNAAGNGVAWFCGQLNMQQPLNQTLVAGWKVTDKDTIWVGEGEPFPFQIGDRVEPDDFTFPWDRERFGLHRDCAGTVTRVWPHQVTVDWNPSGPYRQSETYASDALRKTSR